MKEKIYIYGASGHGLVVADVALSCGYDEIIFVDDGDNEYLTFEDIKNDNNIPIAFGIGDNFIRRKLFNKVESHGFKIVTLIHKSAVVSNYVSVGKGTVIMPNVVINSGSKVGQGVILNTSSVVEHENIIEDFVHISPNAALAGNVTIKKNTHVGIGSCVIQNLTIGENCIIGAGSVVVKSIDSNKLCYGNPCEIIKELT